MAPLVERWSEEYGTRGVNLIKIMVKENELIGLDFLKHYRSTFPHAVDFDGSVTEAYHANSWPNAVIIDKEGKVTAHEYILKGGIEVLEEAMEKVASPAAFVAASLKKGMAFCRGGICYAPPGGKKLSKKTRVNFPSLSAAADGSTYLAYTSNESGDNNVFLERYKRGKRKHRYQITVTPSDEYDADIAASTDGTIWIAWTSNLDSTYDIYCTSFQDGKLARPSKITDSSNDAFHPRIALDANGSPSVTYYKWITKDGVSNDRNIYARSMVNGEWSEEMEISPIEPSVEDHSDPDIIGALGGMLVVWSYDYHPSLPGNNLDAGSPTVFVQKLAHSASMNSMEKQGGFEMMGSRGEKERIKDISPAIASYGENVACAWDAGKSIVVRRFKNGSWNPVEKINSRRTPCNSPAIAMSSNGIFVCYSQLIDGRWQIVGRSFSNGIWDAPEMKNKGSGSCRYPAVTCDKRGTPWIAYAEETEKGVFIRLRRW